LHPVALDVTGLRLNGYKNSYTPVDVKATLGGGVQGDFCVSTMGYPFFFVLLPSFTTVLALENTIFRVDHLSNVLPLFKRNILDMG
jgi:hypothetical protein